LSHKPEERCDRFSAVKGKYNSVQNVNARGRMYFMWIIVHKCEGGCKACLVRMVEQILVRVLVGDYAKTGGR